MALVLRLLSELRATLRDLNSKSTFFLPRPSHIGRALLVYCSSGSFGNHKIKHTNILECKNFIASLIQLGFKVDLISFDSNFPVSYKNYDVIIGLGNAYARALRLSRQDSRTIYYATGSPSRFSINQSAYLFNSFVSGPMASLGLGELVRKGMRNSLDESFQEQHSGALIALGNGYHNKYFSTQNPIYQASPFYLPHPMGDSSFSSVPLNRSWSNRENVILWFGSQGVLHKGLHQFLLTLSLLPSYKGIVVGVTKSEVELYEKMVHKLNLSARTSLFPSITPYDHSGISLLSTAKYVLHPSISEGGACGLLTAMIYGHCYPIYTSECSLCIPYIPPQHNWSPSMYVELAETVCRLDDELSVAETLLHKSIHESYSRHSVNAHFQEIYSALSRELFHGSSFIRQSCRQPS